MPIPDPKDLPKSESAAIRWFKAVGSRIGLSHLEHVGDGPGPPDFVAIYDNEIVAIEVRLLVPSAGWSLTKEMGFASRLRKLIAEVYDASPAGPKWHVICEYDPSQPCPSPSCTTWKTEARRLLNTPGLGGRFPLLPCSQQKGDGLELILIPVPPEAARGHLPEHEQGLVASSHGSAPLSELVAVLPSVIAEKTNKVRNRTRYKSCPQWWLLLDDDILIAPASILRPDERKSIFKAVAECPDISFWSKAVLFNRRQPTPPPDLPPGWFWVLWESTAHSPLRARA